MKRKISIFTFVLFTFAIFGICLSNIKANDELKDIKKFLNTKEIVIEHQMKEDKDTIVYKIHDVTNDKYYKLASYEGKINWYDDILSKNRKVIDYNLEQKLESMSNEEELEVMVELVFNDNEVFDKLARSYPQYFNKNNEMKNTLSSQEVELADTKRREILKSTFTTLNQESLKDYNIKEISEHTPFSVIKATKEEITRLAQNDKVLTIGLVYKLVNDDIDYNNLNVSKSASAVAINNNPIYSTMVNQIHALGQKGSGVKIGQIESGVPNKSNAYLSGKSITTQPGCSIDYEHATEIAGILVGSNGVAPSASLYSACYSQDSSFALSIAWLINNGVKVINMSAFMQSELASYHIGDRYIDAVVHYTDVVFVKSSGNNPNPVPCLGANVTSPGKAFNVITVGNLEYNASDSNNILNADMHSSSCYNTPSTAGSSSNKPDIVAPGSLLNYTNAYSSLVSGTSLSAPLVAGTAALILAQNPNLPHKAVTIKSALIATARPLDKYPRGYLDYNISGYPSLRYNHNDRTGAGVLNAKGAYDLIRWGQYQGYYTANTTTYTKYLSGGANVTVAVAWDKPNTLNNIEYILGYTSYSTDTAYDFDLEILGPSGQKINKSSSWRNNIEFITFNTSYGTGNYKFQITYYASNGNVTIPNIGLTWW